MHHPFLGESLEWDVFVFRLLSGTSNEVVHSNGGQLF